MQRRTIFQFLSRHLQQLRIPSTSRETHTQIYSERFEPNSLPVYSDGSNVREWIYVEDNCRTLDTVLRDGEVGEVYNIGSHVEKTNLEATEAILDAVDASKDLIKLVDDRAGHDQRHALETEKIESLGWEPKYSFEEELEHTVGHYLK